MSYFRGERKRLTHFLGIPIDHQNIVDKVKDFHTDILKNYSQTIDEGWFMPIPKLHFR